MSAPSIDKFRGVLYGQAIGDALGFGTEFLSRSEVRMTYPEGLSDYPQIRFFSYITGQFESGIDERWQPGDWTDDTAQTLCILDSLLACGQVDTHDIARRLHTWAETDGFGIGETVSNVVFNSSFLRDPQGTASAYWESKNRNSAANGGVMRTSVLGLWEYSQPERIKENASQVCRITHADPRCIASCIAVSLAISRLIQGEDDIKGLIAQVEQEVFTLHPEISDYFTKARQPSLDDLNLDQGLNENEPVTLGYTLKTLGASFWALHHAESFADGIYQIIAEGGDADTNAAVAGALLGARFGFEGIEKHLIDGLRRRDELDTRILQLYQNQLVT